MIGHPGVVTVEKGDELTPSLPNGIVSCSGRALVFLLDVDNPVQVGREHFFQFGRIRGAVVDNDCLEIRIGLCKHRVETCRDHVRGLVGRE